MTALALALGWRFIRYLPRSWAYGLFDLLADSIWWRQGSAVRQLEANLRRVRPHTTPGGLRLLSRAGMRSYSRYWCDSFRLPGWSSDHLAQTVCSIGDEPVRRALAQGQGAVVFLGHLGNWDHAGAWSSQFLAPVTTVAERLRPDWVFRQFVGFREKLGMRVIPLDPGLAVFRELLGAAQAGGFVPLLADRDLTGGGVPVSLFGQTVRAAPGPAALAQRTGAALFALAIHYRRLAGAGHGIVLTWQEIATSDLPSGRAGLVAATQRCVDHIEAGIRSHPADWHMLQPIFDDDRASR